MSKAAKIAPNRHATHPFDQKYGVETGGYLSPDELSTTAANDAMNNGYSAVAPSVFWEAIRRWRDSLPASASRPEAYTFVDVGAGKGRTLLLASELPFRKVIGVELNTELAQIGERNIAIWKQSRKQRCQIQIRQEDALAFRWPRAPLLVYLNNPFDCELVERLTVKLAGIATAGPCLVDVIYVNPACTDAFTRSRETPGELPGRRYSFDLLWNAQIEMDEGDRTADPYGASSDRVAAFRFGANQLEEVR